MFWNGSRRRFTFFKKVLFFACAAFALKLSAKEILTNSLNIRSAPSWLKESQVERTTQRIQAFLEWNIRRANVFFYDTPEAFQKVHSYGPTVLAFSREKDNSIHLGPKVTVDTFDRILGHEMVHIILYQKYKDAIPSWLVEGLANYASKNPVDYAWLNSQPFIEVTSLTHPYKGTINFKYHYFASTAVMEMIASKCSLKDLLQLSVGKKIETYLATYCEITDLNGDFKNWIKKKASRR